MAESRWPALVPSLSTSCDCCERLPRGTVAAVVELLGGDRPDVAALLRAAVVESVEEV